MRPAFTPRGIPDDNALTSLLEKQRLLLVLDPNWRLCYDTVDVDNFAKEGLLPWVAGLRDELSIGQHNPNGSFLSVRVTRWNQALGNWCWIPAGWQGMTGACDVLLCCVQRRSGTAQRQQSMPLQRPITSLLSKCSGTATKPWSCQPCCCSCMSSPCALPSHCSWLD